MIYVLNIRIYLDAENKSRILEVRDNDTGTLGIYFLMYQNIGRMHFFFSVSSDIGLREREISNMNSYF